MGSGGVGPPGGGGGEWTASEPGRFTSWEIAPPTHWMGGGVGAVDLLSTDKARALLKGTEMALNGDF